MWQSLSEKRPKMLSQRYQKVLLVIFILAGVVYISLSLAKESLPNVELASLIGENHPLVKYLSDGTYPVQSFAVDDERMQNSKSQQIFFLETHLGGQRTLNNSRQACSVESAARANPDLDIYFFLATNESRVVLEHTPILDALLAYPNIRIRYINITEYTKGTKLEKFFQENPVAKSEHQIEHTSDILRILTLNKYGGLYLDLDVISLFPVRMINKNNFVCLEGSTHFSNAIIKLDKDEGKKYSDKYLDLLIKGYDPKQWASNGPDMVSAAFLSYCNGTKLPSDKTGKCDNLTALANEKCFLYMYGDFRKFYEDQFVDEVLEKMARIGVFFIHIWNKMLAFNRKTYQLPFDSKAAYLEVGRVYCPKTVATRNYFRRK